MGYKDTFYQNRFKYACVLYCLLQLDYLIMLKFEMQIHFTNWLDPSEQIKIIAALFHPN